MLKQKTSVVFINSSDKETKTIQVPTVLLEQWKYYIVIIFMVFVVLIGLLMVYINKKVVLYYQSYYQEKLKYSNEVVRAVDFKRVKKTFESIDGSISRINCFMEERDLEKFKLQPIKQKDPDIRQLNKVSAHYLSSILAMEELLAGTPIGKPNKGKQTSGFGFRENPFGTFATESHKGVDFSGVYGSAVKSTAEGKIIFAGKKGGYGNCIIIRHVKDFETLYGHLSGIDVEVGQIVKVGTVIGKLGSTGRSTGPHLHYEIMLKGEKIDPQDYLKL